MTSSATAAAGRGCLVSENPTGLFGIQPVTPHDALDLYLLRHVYHQNPLELLIQPVSTNRGTTTRQ